jgi:hypothetical protein
MTRYWKIGDNTLGTSSDDVDLATLPGVEELTEAEWMAASEAITSASPPPAPQPVTTSLQGNGLSYVTDPAATRVTVQVIAPIGGPVRARPTVDGQPVSGGAGPFVYDNPGHAIVIGTRAGNNDVVVIEEFS